MGTNNASTTGCIGMTLLPSVSTLAQMQSAMDQGAGLGAGNTFGPLSDSKAKTKYFSQYQGSRGFNIIKSFIKTRTLFPAKDVSDDPDFTGTTASYTSGYSRPVNTMYWYVITTNTQATATISLATVAHVTFYVKFSSPVVLGAS